MYYHHLEVKVTKGKGRGFFAKEDIEPNTNILISH